ncbi:hypothetical protein NDU88_001057, partial [Pleurodeles waltl]
DPEESSFDLDPGSITDREDGVVASQGPCLVTDGTSSSESMRSDVQNPDGCLFSEPDTPRSMQAGLAASSLIVYGPAHNAPPGCKMSY